MSAIETEAAKAFHCAECGEPLINTVSGKASACPSGCGRLKPKLPPSVARVNAAKVCADARSANALQSGKYRLHGLDGEWDRVGRAISAPLSRAPSLTSCRRIGLLGDKVYWFELAEASL